MHQHWQMWEGWVSSQTCDAIVEEALKMPPEPAYVSNLGGGIAVDCDVRDSELRWLDNQVDENGAPLWTQVWNLVKEHCILANRNAFNIDLGDHYIRSMQFTTYKAEKKKKGDKAHHFNSHMDTFLCNGNVQDRKLSFTLQLSDPSDYDGAVFDFTYLSDCNKPDPEKLAKKGTILVFPSLLRHSVSPITRGVRHSLVAWMEGPPWR